MERSPQRWWWMTAAGLVLALAWRLAPAQPVAEAAAPSFLEKRAPAAPGDIDVENSRVYAHVGKTGFGHEHGVVGFFKSGVVHLGAAQKAGQMTFDITSFVADTKEARAYVGLDGETAASTAQQVTHNMMSAEVLDAKQFPTARFDIDSALPLQRQRDTDPERYELTGKFTLHGVTRPLKFVAEVRPAKGKLHLRGGFSILQTSFGITPYSKALGAVGVADKLQIYGEVWVAAPAN